MCPPLEFVLHVLTLLGAFLKILNRLLCPLLQKPLDETLSVYVGKRRVKQELIEGGGGERERGEIRGRERGRI